MEQENNSVNFSEELEYSSGLSIHNCHYCNKMITTSISSDEGYYVCDSCNSKSDMDIIKDYCANTREENPFHIMNSLMKHPTIGVHGQEHHFLVTAVLISAYYNTTGEFEKKPLALMEAEKRARGVIQDLCVFYGTCGAAISTGTFISIIKAADVSSEEEWSLANLMTSDSLRAIAMNGGPRCCKRHSYLVVEEAVKFADKNLKVRMEMNDEIKCEFSEFNAHCNKTKCICYKNKHKEKIRV